MKDFMAINIKHLKCGGIYPPQTKSKLKNALIWLFNITWVFYSMVFFVICELYALKESSSSDINGLIKNLNLSISCVLTTFKVAVWVWKFKELTAIITFLQSTADNFVSVGRIDSFDPEMIIQKDKRSKDRMIHIFGSITFLIGATALIQSVLDANGVELHEVELPYHTYVWFDYQQSMLHYTIASTYQCLALLGAAIITSGIDLFVFSLVYFTSTHFKLLQGGFTTVKEKALITMETKKINRSDRGKLEEVMYDELRSYIQHLQLILEICDKLEAIFNVWILLQMLVSLVIFCASLYVIFSINSGNSIPIDAFVYMLAIENQLALYCYAGDELTTCAAGIPNALYNSDWLIATSTKYRRNIILTMMRMTKPVHLTAGKFAALTLATFVTIGRGSYSLLAVLNSTDI